MVLFLLGLAVGVAAVLAFIHYHLSAKVTALEANLKARLVALEAKVVSKL